MVRETPRIGETCKCAPPQRYRCTPTSPRARMARSTRAAIRPKSAAAAGDRSQKESTCARLDSQTVPGKAHPPGGCSVQMSSDHTWPRTRPVQMLSVDVCEATWRCAGPASSPPPRHTSGRPWTRSATVRSGAPGRWRNRRRVLVVGGGYAEVQLTARLFRPGRTELGTADDVSSTGARVGDRDVRVDVQPGPVMQQHPPDSPPATVAVVHADHHPGAPPSMPATSRSTSRNGATSLAASATRRPDAPPA